MSNATESYGWQFSFLPSPVGLKVYSAATELFGKLTDAF